MNDTQQNYMSAVEQLYSDWNKELKNAKSKSEIIMINSKYENKLEDVGC